MNETGKQFYEFVKAQGIQVPETYEEFETAMQDYNTASQFYGFLKSNNITVPESVDEFKSVFSSGGAYVNFTEGSKEPQEQPSQPSEKSGTKPSVLVEQDLPVGVAAADDSVVFELPKLSTDDYLANQKRSFEGEIASFEDPIEYTEEEKQRLEQRKNQIAGINSSTYFELDRELQDINKRIESGVPVLTENVGPLADRKKQIEEQQRLAFIKLESDKPTIENYDRVVSAIQEVRDTNKEDYDLILDYAKNYFNAMDAKVKEAIDNKKSDPAFSVSYMSTQDDAGRSIPDDEKIDQATNKILKQLGIENVDEKVDGRLSIGKQRLGKNLYQKVRDDLKNQVESTILHKEALEKAKPQMDFSNKEAFNAELEKEISESAPRIQEEQLKLEELSQRYGEKLQAETSNAYQQYVDAIFALDSRTSQQLSRGVPEEGVMRAYRMEQKRLFEQYSNVKESIQQDLNSKYLQRANQLVSNIDVLTNKAAERAAKNVNLSEDQQKKAQEIYNQAYNDVLSEREEALRVYEDKIGLPAALINTYAGELGRSVGAIGRSAGVAPLTQFGEAMQTQYPYVNAEMEDWGDIFNIEKLAKTTAKLAGGMTPSVVATAGAALATAGAGAVPAMAASAVAGWGLETLDMTGQMYKDTYEKTGSVMEAENAASQMAEAQIRNWYLYSFEGLPFVGKALRGMGVARRVATGAAVETGTEFVQEFTQTAQEKAIEETGSFKGYGKYMTSDVAKRTFLNIAPVALLGGGGQIVSARNEKLAGKKAYEAIKNTFDIANVTPDARNQFLLRTFQEQGPTFTNGIVGGYYSSGMIDKAQFEEMRQFVNKQAPVLTSTARSFNLTPEQTIVYSSLSNHYKNLKETADSIEGDDIAKGVAMDRANAFKKETEAFLNDPEKGGAFVAVQQAGTTGNMIYMSTAEFQDYISQPGVAQSIVDGDVNFYARNIEPEQIKKQIIKKLTGDAIAKGIITESGKSEYQTAQEGRISTTTSGSDSTIEVGEVQEVEAAPTAEKEEKVTAYLQELTKTKESNPEAYWSVDQVTEKAAREGTIIDTEDGAAVVGPDGDIKGVFKKLGSTAKGVAQNLLKKAVEAGGTKLDNFVTGAGGVKLQEVYERAGFRVVSRLPFNEEFAPVGWTEKDGRPDVVAMIYDPNKELDIEERTFDDYDEAMAYRDSYLTEPTQETEAALDIDQEVQDLESLISEANPDFQLATDLTPEQKKEELTKAAIELMDQTQTQAASDESFTVEQPEVKPITITITENTDLANKVRRMGLEELIGKKVNLVMADRLKVGDGRMGGPFFPLIDENFGKVAWASIDKNAAMSIIRGSIGADYSLVFNMGEGAIDSNVAMVDTLIEKLESMPDKKKNQALKEIKDHIRSLTYKIEKVDFTDRVVNAIDKVNTTQDFRDFFLSFNTNIRAKITNSILPSKNIDSKGGVKEFMAKEGITLEGVRDENSEQFVKDLPQGAVTMVLKIKDSQGNNVTDKTAEDALMTPEQQEKEGVKPHPNYPFYIRGEVVGIPSETVPFWRMFPSKLSTINAKIAGVIGGKKPTSAQALAAEGRRASMQASKQLKTAAPQATQFETFVSILNKAFPNLEVITDSTQFSQFIDDVRAKKLITNKGQKVYGAVFEGKLYLNPDLQNFNTPVHEFGHAWLNAAKELRPEIYQKGLQLIEGSEYIDQVKNNKAYQAVIKKLRDSGSTEAEIDEYVKEEALATAIGDKGEAFVNAAQKKEFKTWLQKLFDFVRKLTGLSKYSAEEIQNITLDEFLQGVVVDILSGEQIFEGAANSKTDSLQLMAKESKGDINQIVAKARENNFTDDVIRRFLEKNGYKKGDIKTALEVQIDLFETLPQAYGNVKGGQDLYNKVKTELQSVRKKADKSLETEAGVKNYLNKFVSPEELLGYDKVIENPTVSRIAKAYGEALKTDEDNRTTKQKQIIYRVNQTVRNSVGDRVIQFLQNQPEYKALEKNNEWSKTESLVTETRDALGYKVRKTQKVIQDAINEVTGVTKPTPETIKVTAKQLRSWAEKDSAMGAVAARQNQREIDRVKRQLRRDTVAALKDAVSIGKISVKQSAAIINKFDKINWSNPASRQRFIDYFIKVAEKAENIANLQEASNLRRDIKKSVKDKKKDAILRASAKRFLAVDPTMVESIDDYLDIARDIKSGLVRGKAAFNTNVADVYSANEIQRQKEIAEELLRENFESITGIDPKNLTVAEMMAMMSEEQSADLTDQKKREARAAAEKLIGFYTPIADRIVSSGKDPFTGDDLDLDPSQRAIVKRLLGLDLGRLDTSDLVRVADMLNNFITNYEVGGIGAMVNQLERLENVDSLIKKGFKAKDLNIYWNKKLGTLWNTYLAPVPTVLDSMFGGVTKGAAVSRAIGFSNIVDGAAQTERESNVVFEALTDKYKDKGTAGAEFISDQNMVDVGMAGYIGRKPVTDNEVLIAEEFEKRKQNLKDSIENLKESGEKNDLKLADLYEDAYNRLVEGAANADEVFSRLGQPQKDFITDLIGIFKGIKPLQDEVSLNVFNEILGESQNYLPDVYGILDKTKRKKITEEFIQSPTGMSSFAAFANSPLTKAGNFMEQKTPKTLKGSSKYVKLNLLENASQAYRNIMLDVNTAEDIRGMYAVLNSEAFRKLVPNAQDRALFRDRVDSYILSKKGKSAVVGNQDLNQALNYFAKIATTKALGSLAQVPKQYIPVMTNTLINLGSDASLLNLVLDADANDFIERSGKAIATRGIQSLATIESMNTLLNKGTYDNKVASYIEKAGDFWLQNFLVKPDVSIARASWMAYYKKSLKDQGLSTDIDFKNDEINQKAADYAQSMVDRQQNVSDADLQGKFFTSRDTSVKFIRQVFFPFASFSTNQKARLFSDISTLNNETATVEDRRTAAKSLAATISESIAFHLISVGITALIYNVASELMGGDEDEEYIKKQIASRVLSIGKDMLSPVPLFDPVVDGTFNAILDAMDVDKGYRAYGRFSDLTQLDVGVYAIPFDRIAETTDALSLALTGESGNKVISSSDQQAVAMAAVAMMLHNGGVLPADFQSVARRIIKEAKNKGRTQKQIESALKNRRGGLSVSGRGL